MHYVNVYKIYRLYGGPEEGGWWYDAGDPVSSEPFPTRAEAEARADALRERYKDSGYRYSVAQRDDDDDYRVLIEDHFARHFPVERPRYE